MSNKNLDTERETAHNYETPYVKLFSDDPTYTDRAIKNIGKTLDKIRKKNGWTNNQLLHHLDMDVYKSEAALCRLIYSAEGRQPSVAQFIELRRVFGVDLNAIADGENPFVLEKLSDFCLCDLMNKISAELLKRSGKKDCQ